MSKINLLSEYVANQIAAGEVVRNGASVVKELMENSMDAGCSWIIVSIKGGGTDFIQVADDGCGMSYDDALKSFSRHATSKISDVNDIFQIKTFGFRGEALPSIASVAEVELKSCREDDQTGVLVQVNGSELIQHVPCGMSKGTQIIVKNLFYNIPARRKHLKTPQRETRYIIDEFMKIALCYPNIALFLYNDDVCVYNFKSSNLRQRVVSVMSSVMSKTSDKDNFASMARVRNAAAKCNGTLVEVFAETSIVKVCGYVGKPETAKKTTEQYLFVNGRYFKSAAFRKAVQNAYGKLLPDQTILPPYFIYLTIDPSKIDVNIHPSKTEVKFEEENEIWQIINATIRESLGKHGIVPMIDFEAGTDLDIHLLKHGDDFKMPEIDINPEFNPFDESFSFTNAVKGIDETFRSNFSGGSYAVTPPSSTSVDTKEFFVADWENDFYNAKDTTENLKDYESSKQEYNDEDSYDKFIISSSEGSEDEYIDIESSGDNDIDISSLIDIENDVITENSIFEPQRTTITSASYYRDNLALAVINGDVYVVDLQRATNRVIYNRMERQITENDTFLSQKLLFPVTFSLSIQDAIVVRESIEEFRFIGFDITITDDDTLKIDGVPAQWSTDDVDNLFEEVLTSLKMDEMYSFKQSKREKMIIGMSGIYSRRNEIRSKEQVETCLYELFKCDNFTYTPAGHKIFVGFGINDIKRMFH